MAMVHKYTGGCLAQPLEELLEEIATSIRTHYPEAQVYLFGSYAWGDYNKDSDFDICVLVSKIVGRRIEMNADISCTIREDFPVPFDILLYTYDEFDEYQRHKSSLPYKIKEKGRLLHV
ncbi:MAG: nucleotidyltransferase domain-containing protein [Defluviitaleaceae bacterium]|nr:nucleotidyltransferase domain-containing protein [Defluviitaleaceae bacterium]MCL2238596.1 nucleotidyltransferase domain-containing protein [Defluviitaleaceae bacterium]